ncbi:FAD-dependent monooxygenase [Roseicella sp. DB1501]|uniref:FAD-dependent monooxygenase n=1 Tax=Roseicella sp. DB1501 TaxID=2730925 RepID=UPI001491E046|nr:FAD-dependent monooxygenase [Roseicella sp. DB1501]NOG69310.1 NAD(P)-binding protein [Roseicella sp. DB1501]
MEDVLVVGAGPVGLTMACELARHGRRCRIIDRMPAPSPYCRAIGVTPRTIEVWEDMGIAREMVDAGLWLTGLRSVIHGRPPMDARPDLPAMPFSQLGLPQYETERLLTAHLHRFGIGIERGIALTGLTQEAEGVSARLAGADGREGEARFRYVIGCDGAHSAVRRALGIGFEGEALPMTFMLGDVHIGWDLPYGTAFRALRLHEDAPPDLLVAVPLPEHGRYRVTMVAPPELVPAGGTGHGIQAETKGPSLPQLQAVADDLLPDRPPLSDLRWSSIFRISMRLAAHYRVGRCFIAGDAAHIHPPTGGQGMNTGIQDAYNLAWKLALVLDGAALPALLDSYEAERRPVGAAVIARTTAATAGFGREAGGAPDRLADTQIPLTYRGTAWVTEAGGAAELALPMAGDRAPDAEGLRRRGFGFPLRLFDLLRGTAHVLLVRLPEAGAAAELAALGDRVRALRDRLGDRLRVVAVTGVEGLGEEPGIALVQDAEGHQARAYGAAAACHLIRPDGYIGWRGPDWREPGLEAHLGRIFGPARG